MGRLLRLTTRLERHARYKYKLNKTCRAHGCSFAARAVGHESAEDGYCRFHVKLAQNLKEEASANVIGRKRHQPVTSLVATEGH